MNQSDKPNYADQPVPHQIGWRNVAAWGLAAVSIVVALSAAYMLGRSHASTPAGVEIVLPTPSPIKVQVTGAVINPGLVELRRGDRIDDALEAAGGAAVDAALGGMNLAAIATDGMHIRVPRLAAVQSSDEDGIGTPSLGDEFNLVATPAAAREMVAPNILAPAVINLNTATIGDLMDLPNIGPARAQAIINLRDSRGGFATIDDLDDVTGIGPAIIEALRTLVTVQ